MWLGSFSRNFHNTLVQSQVKARWRSEHAACVQVTKPGTFEAFFFPFFQKSFVLESPLPASITGMRNESTHWDWISICECAMLLSGSFCSVIKLYKVCCNTVIIFISHNWMQHCFKIWQLNISQIHENIQWEQFTTCLFTYKFLTAPEWIVSVSSL